MNVWTESLLAHLETFRAVDERIPCVSFRESLTGILEFTSSPLSLARRRYAKYGPIYNGRAFGRNVVVMLGPDASEFVLMDRQNAFSSRKAWMAGPMGLYFPNGLLLLDPPEHMQHRRVMQMAFTSEALSRHLALMSPIIEESVERLVPPTEGSTERIRIFPTIKELALTFSAKVFLGEDLGPKTEALNAAFLDVVEASGPLNLIPHVPIPFTLAARGRKARKLLEDYFFETLPRKRRSDEDDFFSLMCRAETPEGDRFTDREIVDHMIFLMMAAHDTSTITATNMAYHLAKHPEWQERLRDEVMRLPDGHPSREDLDAMTDMDLVIKEALRLMPPLSLYPRMAVEDVEYGGYTIKKGNGVLLVPSFTHRMPELWTHPDRFDPERFSPERAEDKSHRFAWMPFGGGYHKCLGMRFGPMEVKSIYIHLLRRYRWTIRKGYRIRYNNMSLGKPWDGLPVEMTRIR